MPTEFASARSWTTSIGRRRCLESVDVCSRFSDRHLESIMLTRIGQWYHVGLTLAFCEDPKPLASQCRFPKQVRMSTEVSSHYGGHLRLLHAVSLSRLLHAVFCEPSGAGRQITEPAARTRPSSLRPLRPFSAT